jgi:hypothetical protein
MNYFKARPTIFDFFPKKGEWCILITKEEDKEKILSIIKSMSSFDWDYFPSDTPFEILKEEDYIIKDNNFVLLKNEKRFPKKYYGKFELDLEMFYEVCNHQNIITMVLASVLEEDQF